MRPAWRLAINSLSGRRSRTALLVMAVLLSSALIAAVSCALASVQAGLRARVEATLGASDLRVTKIGKDLFEQSVLETVRSWPEVRLATGRLRDSLLLEHRKAQKQTGTLANGIMPGEERVRPITLVAGRLPTAAGEIALDEQAAKVLRASVGDTLHQRAPDNALRTRLESLAAGLGLGSKAPPVVREKDDGPGLTVVGITSVPSIGVGVVLRSEVMVTIEQLRSLTGRGKLLSDIDAILVDSGQAEALAKGKANAFEQGVVVSPSSKITSGLDRNVRQSQIGMTIASLLAYLAASFIIMTGLTTSVNERQRELAMVRCVGGTRWQMAEMQLVIGGIIGFLGAAVGVPLGMLGAFILVKALPAQLPGGFAVDTWGLTLAVIGSLVTGLLGAIWPAIRAARTTPLQALAVRATAPRKSRLVLCGVIGLCLIIVHLCVIYLPKTADTIFWLDVTIGLPSMFVGYFLLSVPVLVLVTIGFGRLISIPFGLPGQILARTVLATPYKFGFTAGAMMMGLALLIAIWTNGRSVVEDWLKNIRFPDAFVAGIAITDETRAKIDALPFVTKTVAIQVLPMRTDAFGLKAFDHTGTNFIAFEPEPFFSMTTLQWVEGSPEVAIPKLNKGGAILVAREFQNARGIKVGDALTLRYNDTPHTFEVVGVVSSPGLDIVNQWFEVGENYTEQAVNAVFGSRKDMRERFGVDSFRLLQVGLKPEFNGKPLNDAEAISLIKEAAGSGILDAGSGRQIIGEVRMFLEGSLYVFSLVAVGAMLVACFGVSNLIVAGIQARQFEFGVLRAIGSSSGMVMRLVMAEAMLIAITACILGTVMGIHGAKAGQRVNELLVGIKLEGWPSLGPTMAGWLVLTTITLCAAAPAIWALGRKKPRELLGAVRG